VSSGCGPAAWLNAVPTSPRSWLAARAEVRCPDLAPVSGATAPSSLIHPQITAFAKRRKGCAGQSSFPADHSSFLGSCSIVRFASASRRLTRSASSSASRALSSAIIRAIWSPLPPLLRLTPRQPSQRRLGVGRIMLDIRYLHRARARVMEDLDCPVFVPKRPNV